LINKAAPSNKALEAIVLMKLREICGVLPEVVETVKWGHPTFEAGKKIFAVLDLFANPTQIKAHRGDGV